MRLTCDLPTSSLPVPSPHFRQSKLFKMPELPSVLCIQTILDSPWETKTFQLLSDVLGIKTKLLKQLTKTCLVWPLYPSSMSSQNILPFTIVNLLSIYISPRRVMFLLIARLLYGATQHVECTPLFSFPGKIFHISDVSSQWHILGVNFFAKHFRTVFFSLLPLFAA